MSGPLLGGAFGRGAAAVRVAPLQLAILLALGIAAGLVMGYVLMGTAHAIMEIGADRDKHYKHDE
jgi:hypothetical protein